MQHKLMLLMAIKYITKIFVKYNTLFRIVHHQNANNYCSKTNIFLLLNTLRSYLFKIPKHKKNTILQKANWCLLSIVIL